MTHRSFYSGVWTAALLCALSGAAAADDMGFMCAHPANSTAFFLRTVGDEVVADFVHRGTQFVPLGDDAPTSGELPAAAEKAKLVASLGARWTLRWPRANCRMDGRGRFDCGKGTQWQKV